MYKLKKHSALLCLLTHWELHCKLGNVLTFISVWAAHFVIGSAVLILCLCDPYYMQIGSLEVNNVLQEK